MSLDLLLREAADEIRSTTAGVAIRHSRRRTGLRVALASAATVILVVGLIGAFGSRGAPGDTSAAPSTPDDRQPADEPGSITFEFFDGSSGRIADYLGRPLVLNFWASWCSFCEAKMRDALGPASVERGDEIGFLGLNLDYFRADAEDLIAVTGISYDLAIDGDGEIYRELDGIDMPYTLFFSKTGELLERVHGPINRTELDDLIDSILVGSTG